MEKHQLNEKIVSVYASVYVPEKNTSTTPSYLLTFETLPANYRFNFSIYFFALNIDKKYKMHISLSNEAGKELINQSLDLDMNTIIVKPTDRINDNLVGTSLNLRLSPVLVPEKTEFYQFVLDLRTEDNIKSLDKKTTYFSTKHE